MDFALLHSPFLAPSSSEPLAQALRLEGARVRVLSAQDAFEEDGVDYKSVSKAIVAQLDESCALVVHSGSGGLVLSILSRADEAVRCVIFVDAILPHDGKSWFDTAPEALAKRVRESAVEGRARPWSDWLDDAVLRSLVPNESERTRLLADLPHIPVAFLEQPAPIEDQSLQTRCAYLQLSDGYAAEAAGAAALGWKIGRLNGHHLWWVTHPTEVARSVIRIARRD